MLWVYEWKGDETAGIVARSMEEAKTEYLRYCREDVGMSREELAEVERTCTELRMLTDEEMDAPVRDEAGELTTDTWRLVIAGWPEDQIPQVLYSSEW